VQQFKSGFEIWLSGWLHKVIISFLGYYRHTTVLQVK
jgi:hypothetical protein